MAQVVRDHESGRILNHRLERLLRFWRAVPELAAEWPEWDENSRLDLIHQWPTTRGTLWRVSEAWNAGLLDERQQRDWQELQQLIETHRVTVEQMLGEPI